MSKTPQYCAYCLAFGQRLEEMPCKVGYLHYMAKGYDCPYFDPKEKPLDTPRHRPGARR